MRNCLNKDCSNLVPNTIKIDGRYRNLKSRKYCFECSPFGQHNTKKLEKSIEKSIYNCICEKCKKEYIYSNSKKVGHTKNLCNSCIVSMARQHRKRMAVEYKGGGCQICKYNKCMRALEFHHLDPTKKDFGFSEGGYNRSWEMQKAELDKCILLCSRCHAEVHDGMIVL